MQLEKKELPRPTLILLFLAFGFEIIWMIVRVFFPTPCLGFFALCPGPVFYSVLGLLHIGLLCLLYQLLLRGTRGDVVFGYFVAGLFVLIPLGGSRIAKLFMIAAALHLFDSSKTREPHAIRGWHVAVFSLAWYLFDASLLAYQGGWTLNQISPLFLFARYFLLIGLLYVQKTRTIGILLAHILGLYYSYLLIVSLPYVADSLYYFLIDPLISALLFFLAGSLDLVRWFKPQKKRERLKRRSS